MNDAMMILFGCAVLACAALIVCAVCLGALAQRQQNRRTHRLRFWLRIQGVLR